ncbi:mechanosensitive ion channel family protein [Maribacter arcticus]|uniref:Mechanosensitive ion channel n=1 Tax=Maribacter arcticus TaxID=561365 RepID=A0A1T5CGP9_9FLAO|nr:mechanosensitive ion channel domain-containing protein [Maribacter arcticus]SKB58648.1 Mechanosensitive ion channel [Maribacter arcticus]
MQEVLELFKEPIVIKLATLLLWVVVIIVGMGFLRKLVKRRIDNTGIAYRAQKTIDVVGYFFIILLVVLSFTFDSLKNYTIILGLFTAGIAFTLQELILSIAGSFYILMFRVYKPGDRIEINAIKGDVIDINNMFTTLMEMGEWVSTDNYSGRIVKISNAFVFKGPIKNYSMDFPFVWDELNIPIAYGSDLELAKKIVLDQANELLADYTKNSKAKWEELVDRYFLENAKLDPSIAIRLTDNWVELNLRYITDYKLRRLTKHQLFENIEKAISQSSEKVTLASTTLQLLKIPEMDVRIKQ